MAYSGSPMNSVSHLQKMGARTSHRSSVRTYQLGPGTSKEAFDCMFLCGECGYLCDTDPACPACGQRAWIDLDYWNHAEALRAREEEERRHPPAHLKWQVGLEALKTGGVIGVGSAAGLVLGGLATLGAPLVLSLGAGAAVLTYTFGRRRIGRAIMAQRVETATRWHVPLPLADPKATAVARVVGAVHATGPLLRAPFSGRLCVGYDVGVMFDAPGDAWPPIWVLREMHSCAFEVEGRSIAAESVALALPTPAIAEPVMSAEQKQRFLRERGLFLVDGRFDLFESIIEPDRFYELLWPSAPEGAPPVLQNAPQGRRADPYR